MLYSSCQKLVNLSSPCTEFEGYFLSTLFMSLSGSISSSFQYSLFWLQCPTYTRKKTQFCDSYLFSLWWTHLLNQKLMIWGLYRVWLKGWHVNPTAGRQLGYETSYFTRTAPVEAHRPVQPVAPSLPLRSGCHATTTPSQPRIRRPLPSPNFLWN